MGVLARKLVAAVPLASLGMACSWLPRSDVSFVRICVGTIQVMFLMEALFTLALQDGVRTRYEGIVASRIRSWVFGDRPYRLTPPKPGE